MRSDNPGLADRPSTQIVSRPAVVSDRQCFVEPPQRLRERSGGSSCNQSAPRNRAGIDPEVLVAGPSVCLSPLVLSVCAAAKRRAVVLAQDAEARRAGLGAAC